MEHVLAERGLRLTYLCDPNAIDDLDQDRILDDLSDDADHDLLLWLTRHRMAEYDHLVLVTDKSTGRYLAFLGATDGATAREEFLLIETAFVAQVARGQNLMRRMMALTLLRIGGMRRVPSAIVACAGDPITYRIMRETARRFSNAVIHPDPDSVAINFHAATLAQRVAREIGPNHRFQTITGTLSGARMVATGTSSYRSRSGYSQSKTLAVLDLRGEDEAAIFAGARRLYRAR